MDNQPDVSVIIPVYNAEKTIQRSINSALCQTLGNMEIICIDDGSEDKSIERIQNLQINYSNILLLRQAHKGAGPARNAGIKAAEGKYIAFLDADDEFVDTEALETMVKACTQNSANICGSYRIVCVDGKEQEEELFHGFTIGENGCFVRYSDFQYDYNYQSFLFDREFLEENQIWFPPYMRYQDPPFFVKAMVAAEYFYVVPVILYKYRFDSLKQSVITKNINHILQGIYDTLVISSNNGYEKLFDRIAERVDGQFRNSILQNLSDDAMSLLLAINQKVWQFRGKKITILSDIYNRTREVRNLAYSYELMHKIIMIKQHGNGFKDYFASRKIRTVAVYGLGVYGKILIRELKLCGIEIVCGIDRCVSEYEDIDVINPDSDLPECDVLIVSMMEPETVVRYYEKAGETKVLAFSQIILELAEEIQREQE